MEELEKTGLEDKFGQRYGASFSDLNKRAESCNNVAMVNGFRIEADTLKMRYLNEIAKELEKQKREEPIDDGGDKITKKKSQLLDVKISA